VKTVVDTYAWIEVFIGSACGEKAKEIIQKSEEAYTPDVVIAEVARKYLKEGVKEQTILERLATIEETSEITPIDKNIALESAKCYLELVERAKERKLKAPTSSMPYYLLPQEHSAPNYSLATNTSKASTKQYG